MRKGEVDKELLKKIPEFTRSNLRGTLYATYFSYVVYGEVPFTLFSLGRREIKRIPLNLREVFRTCVRKGSATSVEKERGGTN